MNNSLVIQNAKLSPNFALYAKHNTMIENKKKIESRQSGNHLGEMGMSHQHIVKIQMNISIVFSILWDLKVSLHIVLTIVLTILHYHITQSTKHTLNPSCFSSMFCSYLNFYHDLFQIMINCIFLKIKSTLLCWRMSFQSSYCQ